LKQTLFGGLLVLADMFLLLACATPAPPATLTPPHTLATRPVPSATSPLAGSLAASPSLAAPRPPRPHWALSTRCC
jgi:hypothetical protein